MSIPYSAPRDVLIIDTSIVSGIAWDISDGCDVYISLPHQESSRTVFQHALWGNYRYSLGPSADVAVKRTHNRHTYEWRIDIGRKSQGKVHLQAGMGLGVDVVLGDRDADGSFSWIAWGPGTEKADSPDRVGWVLLLQEGTALGKVKGKIKWEDTEEGTKLGKVRIQSLTSEKVWVEVKTDSQGAYEAELPMGKYQVEAEYGHRKTQSVGVEIEPGDEEWVGEIFFAKPPLGLMVKARQGKKVNAGSGFRQGVSQTWSVADGVLDPQIFDIHQDQKGNLWLGLNGGVSKYDGVFFTRFTTEDGLVFE